MIGKEHDPQVYRYLNSLPDPELPTGLWRKIDSRRRRRQMRSVGWAAAASLAALVVMSIAVLNGPTAPPPPARQYLAAESTSAGRDPEQAWVAEIRALDQQLQAAYERGADAADVAHLWEARRLALAQVDVESGNFPKISLL